MPNNRNCITPENVAHMRAATGLSTADAAAVVHSNASSWNDWENGQSAMDLKRFQLFIQMVSKPRVKSNLVIGFRSSNIGARAKPTVIVYGESLMPLGLLCEKTLDQVEVLSDEAYRATCVFSRKGRKDGYPVLKEIHWTVVVKKAFSPSAYELIERCVEKGKVTCEQPESVS